MKNFKELEVGCQYLMRCGGIVRITESDNGLYSYGEEGGAWRRTGNYWEECESPFDLIYKLPEFGEEVEWAQKGSRITGALIDVVLGDSTICLSLSNNDIYLNILDLTWKPIKPKTRKEAYEEFKSMTTSDVGWIWEKMDKIMEMEE